MDFKEDGLSKVISSKFKQSIKALSSIDSNEDGNEIFVSDEHLLNTSLPIDFKEDGLSKVISSKFKKSYF